MEMEKLSSKFWYEFRQRWMHSRISKGGYSKEGTLTKRYYKNYIRDFAFTWNPEIGLQGPRYETVTDVEQLTPDDYAKRASKAFKLKPKTTTYKIISPYYPLLVPCSLRPSDYTTNPEDFPLTGCFSATAEIILECLQKFPFPASEYPMTPHGQCPFYDRPKTPKVCGPTTCKRWADCEWRNPASV